MKAINDEPHDQGNTKSWKMPANKRDENQRSEMGAKFIVLLSFLPAGI